MQPRPYYQNIWNNLFAEKSMVFMAGPRQTGKTTLAKMLAQEYTNHLYFNWDIPQDRTRLIQDPFFFQEIERRDNSKPMVILDEIHKYKDWKNYLKGAYDRFQEDFLFCVTGSGRLDIYQKGGDSLAGRYFLFHLWPFTLAEICGVGRQMDDFKQNPLEVLTQSSREPQDTWRALETFSGFPEPFLAQRAPTYRRWSAIYAQLLIREDIRDLTDIKAIGDLETLYHLIPSKVGSPISVPSLSRDLKTAYNTVRSWISTFERFFMVFSIGPWTSKITRAIQKERKIYLWDTPRIKEPAARFENMVALELCRAVSVWNDIGWGRFSLHFIKNKEQQEVDFLIADENEPLILIETKLTDTRPSQPLLKYQAALGIPAVQLISQSSGFRILSNEKQQVLVAPAWQWLATLPW